MQEHLTDKHLHVIAPPGSGKTVLGLEVMLRLNKPTLILAPTVAIRNQWIQRFCELFIQTPLTPDWISTDIRKPKFLTVVTYQGLHAACNNFRIIDEEIEESEEENGNEIENNRSANHNLDQIISGLKSQNISTIVSDEAHHLKNEWWQTLTLVKEKLNPIVVGLTATPPYDVTYQEWQRYLELNGPADTEISVPELVIEGDLCPHQDYVFFSMPTESENKKITDFKNNIEKLFQEIINDPILLTAIESQPAWQNPLDHLEWIYNNLSFYSASLIFLNTNEKEIPETHLEIIGDTQLIVPQFDYEWAETLLDFFLFKEKELFIEYQEHQKNIENKLRHYGSIERRQINFTQNKKVTDFLKTSITKLNSIKEIADFEYAQLGTTLRMVILSDYIRKEFLVSSAINDLELNKIGVIPIFEKLRRNNYQHKKIGVLTGSMIIIPNSAYNAFEEKANRCGITNINSSPVPYDPNYILINQTEQLKNEIVQIVTQIFQEGEIEILVGTKSLLGEGWDAPAINSLILASFVGSFVLSNQMRGRAIRTQKDNVDKTGNIWHLVCVDPTSITGGEDLELLKRRFKGFVGVSFQNEPGIENGIGRLNIPENIYMPEVIESKNSETLIQAADRESLKEKWKKALETGVNLIEEIKIPFPENENYKSTKSFYYNKTIAYLMATLGSGLLGFVQGILEAFSRNAKNIRTKGDLFLWLAVFAVIGIVFFGRLTYKTFRLYLKYRDISKDIQKIGETLVNSLIEAGIIHTDIAALKVESSVNTFGAVFCHLEGGTTFEKSTFINSLLTIVGPIDNPRYVIIRKNRLMLFIKQKDFHTVPEILGRNKKLAEFFETHWSNLVGRCELVFTRTIEGRKILLQSRIKSLASQFENKIEQVNKWR